MSIGFAILPFIKGVGFTGFFLEFSAWVNGKNDTISLMRMIELSLGERIRQHQIWKYHNVKDDLGNDFSLFRLFHLGYAKNIYQNYIVRWPHVPKLFALCASVIPLVVYDSIFVLNTSISLQQYYNIKKLWMQFINNVSQLHHAWTFL